MWKKIKQTTSRTVEFVKQKGGNEIEKTNPEYAEAVERYNDIRNHILVFIDNLEKFIDPITKCGPAAADVAKNIERDTANLETASETSKQFLEITTFFSGSLDEKVIKRIREEVLAPLKELDNKFKEYSNMKNEHKSLNLLLLANKEKLAKLQKANKKPEEIQNYQNKVTTKTEQLDQMEAQFIGEINTQWTNRFLSLHKPFVDLSKVLFEFATQVCEVSQNLQQTLGDEVISQEFATA
ncbi:hypothetical protein TRFO_28353 [Tritrichomonas foetus]|uniref:BAR domain-containing protein n=1 Tax=Tritrichomonas foetus TaxID=1144522 RepID=A0A1J4K3D6_9EUKA|nr:hypothetical protein TRFO_28353 [Tritrichomonas foetus]|eukprot:OHT04238.1 hypothetical protein TRFO_28353 [Tritrichomonas foetus]